MVYGGDRYISIWVRRSDSLHGTVDRKSSERLCSDEPLRCTQMLVASEKGKELGSTGSPDSFPCEIVHVE